MKFTSKNIESMCVEEIDEQFLCGICTGVLVEPKQCKSGHVFCGKCIDQWLLQSSKCPICRTTLKKEELSHNRALENMVGRLLVRYGQSSKPIVISPPRKRVKLDRKSKSKNKPEICKWEGHLCDLQNHIDHECKFTLVSCPNGFCRYRRDEMETHLKSCIYQPITCDKCNRNDIARYTMRSHPSKCKGVEIKCENGCGLRLPRGDMSEHKKVCPKEMLSCPFSPFGCDSGKMKRCEYDSHQAQGAIRHSELIAQGMKSLKDAVTKLQNDVGVGKVKLMWDVECNRLVRNSYTQSDKFEVVVPGVGSYTCILALDWEGDEINLIFNVEYGPAFPVTLIFAKFTCGHVDRYVRDEALNYADVYNSFVCEKFLIPAHINAFKTAQCKLRITATIELKSQFDIFLN